MHTLRKMIRSQSTQQTCPHPGLYKNPTLLSRGHRSFWRGPGRAAGVAGEVAKNEERNSGKRLTLTRNSDKKSSLNRNSNILRYSIIILLLTSCASTSISSDLEQIRTLSHLNTLEASPWDLNLHDGITSEDTRTLLRQPLDADAAVRVAVLNNRALRGQLAELGIARGQLVQAGVVPNPILEIEALPERNSSYEFRVEYNLKGLILAPLRSKAAVADLQAERFHAADAVVHLSYEVRSAFYAYQAAQQRLNAAQRLLDTFAAARDTAMALLDAGNIPALEASVHISAYERTRSTVAQLELELLNHKEMLQRLLGLYGDDTALWTVEAPLPLVPETLSLPEQAEARVLDANFELSATRNRLVALAQRAGASQIDGWLPDLTVDVHSLYGTPDETPLSSGQQTWRFGGGVTLSVPLFDRQQGNTRMYHAEAAGLQERYYGHAVDVRSKMRDACNQLQSAHTRARQYQQTIVPALQTVMDQTLLQYNAMQVSIFQLLQSRREQLDVEMSYIETLREYWTAVAAVDAFLAGGHP